MALTVPRVLPLPPKGHTAPPEPKPELTAHRAVKVVLWLAVAIIDGLVLASLGAVSGAIIGCGHGIKQGINRATVDMQEIWRWVQR